MKHSLNEDVTVATNPGATVTSNIADYALKIGDKMYNTMIKNFAKKSGKDLEHVQNLWNKHVKDTKKKYKEDHKDFYPTIVSRLKKSLDLKESDDFVNKIRAILDESS